MSKPALLYFGITLLNKDFRLSPVGQAYGQSTERHYPVVVIVVSGASAGLEPVQGMTLLA